MLDFFQASINSIECVILLIQFGQQLINNWHVCHLTSSCFGPYLTHWGQGMHICVSKLTIIASDNGLSPGRRQAITWANDGILLIWPLGTNFSEILVEIQSFSFKKMHLKIPSGKWRPFCLGLNVLRAAYPHHLQGRAPLEPWCRRLHPCLLRVQCGADHVSGLQQNVDG